MELTLKKAKIEQEMAIAYRIKTSPVVEIEEYIDTSGEGNIGLRSITKCFSAGLGGSGKRVLKRVIRFMEKAD
jgi:hypothetical protein